MTNTTTNTYSTTICRENLGPTPTGSYPNPYFHGNNNQPVGSYPSNQSQQQYQQYIQPQQTQTQYSAQPQQQQSFVHTNQTIPNSQTANITSQKGQET
eukprot:UN13412